MKLLITKGISKTPILIIWTSIFLVILITACIELVKLFEATTPHLNKTEIIISVFLFLVALLVSITFYIIIPLFKQIEKDNEQLRTLASKDPLTGLHNRRIFTEFFEKQVALLKRNQCTESILIILDLDDFKKINDNYGHDIGDLVLKNVADIIRHNSRINDITCRFGGEEFLILLPNTKLNDAIVVINIFRQSMLDMSCQMEIRKLKITASFGMTKLNAEKTFSQHLKSVDKALYKAKEAGKNRIEISTRL